MRRVIGADCPVADWTACIGLLSQACVAQSRDDIHAAVGVYNCNKNAVPSQTDTSSPI